MNNDQRIAFLSSLHEFHVSGGYESGDPTEIQQVVGNVNDREYVVIGTGDSFVEALDDAIQRKGLPPGSDTLHLTTP